MAKKNWALTSYNNATGVAREFSEQVGNLTLTTVAPGGYGQLTARWMVGATRVPPTDLRIFNNVAMTDGQYPPPFLGRWDEPALKRDSQYGEYYEISALGAQNCLTDDTTDAVYAAATAKAIIIDQLQGVVLGRAAWLPIDSDTSQIFPDNPATVYNYPPNGKDIQGVLNEITSLQGDYIWTVLGHPLKRDALGFPTWQLAVHKRDLTTIAYTAILADRSDDDVRPSVEYCFNAWTVKYKDSITGMPASVTVQDGRLNGNKSQGTAPFPYRHANKDLSAYTLTSAQALALANTLVNSYKNGGYKLDFKIARVRDANGVEIPLWRVRADNNIFIPELTPGAAQINPAPQTNINTFYITQTTYTENEGQTPMLEIIGSTFNDQSAYQIARLQYIAQSQANSKRTHGVVQAAGESEIGTAPAFGWGTTVVSTDTLENSVNFRTTMNTVPTSITITPTSSSNANTPTVMNITQTGFSLRIQATVNGSGFWRGTYKTNGN
jgi:hypothetical protein